MTGRCSIFDSMLPMICKSLNFASKLHDVAQYYFQWNFCQLFLICVNVPSLYFDRTELWSDISSFSGATDYWESSVPHWPRNNSKAMDDPVERRTQFLDFISDFFVKCCSWSSPQYNRISNCLLMFDSCLLLSLLSDFDGSFLRKT